MKLQEVRELSLEGIAPMLRDPVTRRPMLVTEEAAVEPTTNARYPRMGNLIDFVGEERVGSSEEHYEKLPFDTVEWSDETSKKEAFDAELRNIIDEMGPDAIVFDVGCGPGRISIPLRQLGRNVVAIDLTRAALEMLQSQVSLPCLRANNLNLPLAEGVADLVISSGVVHHTPDPLQAIAENCRILKSGGRLYLKVFNRDGYYRFMYGWLGGGLRALRRSGTLGDLIVKKLCFPIYRLARNMRPGRTIPREKLRSLFENYFMKGSVTLLRKSEVDSALATNNMTVQQYAVRSTMHCYVSVKK